MKTLRTLSIVFLIILAGSCQNNNTKIMEEEKIPEAWEEMCNSPIEYPAEVYKGGLVKRDAQGDVLNSRGLNYGLITGPWGSSGGGMSRSSFVPTHINCVWLSYAENTFYHIDCAIDHDKMLKLFQEGYPDSLAFINYGNREKSYFNSIITGFAPGGVVIIWLAGGGRQVEIGRYKGEKIEINPSPQELEEIGYPKRNLFDKSYRNFIVTNEDVVPVEVQKANQGKPIPYGLWDTYRTRYSWRPVFEVQEEGKFSSTYFEMINGEKEQLFDQTLIDSKFIKRALPKLINLAWRDGKRQRYGCKIIFDKEEISDAFEEIYKEDKELEAELAFKINHSNTFVTVMLKSGGKKIQLPKTKVRTYKSS